MRVLLLLVIVLVSNALFAQEFSEYKVGHTYYVSIPDYLEQTDALSPGSPLQFQNKASEVYFVGMSESLADLEAADVKANTLKAYNKLFLETFGKSEGFTNRVVGKENEIEVNGQKGVQYSVSMKMKTYPLYYLVTIIKSDTHFYRLIGWTLASQKDKYSEDFKKIAASLRED
jgi:hypothetical protein